MFKSPVVAALILATVAGCEKPPQPPPQARPVRTVSIEHRAEGELVSLTGQVRAKDQASLAFRLDGRMIERPVNVGDVLTAGQLVAKLDPQIQRNAVRSAEGNCGARLASAASSLAICSETALKRARISSIAPWRSSRADTSCWSFTRHHHDRRPNSQSGASLRGRFGPSQRRAQATWTELCTTIA